MDGESGPVALEVQLSAQSFEDYRARTERYARSGVRVIWLSNRSHHRDLQVACYNWKARTKREKYPDLQDMPALALDLRCAATQPDFEKMEVHMPAAHNKAIVEVPLRDLIPGLLENRLRFRQTGLWVWRPAGR
jgi:hypothetical protein